MGISKTLLAVLLSVIAMPTLSSLPSGAPEDRPADVAHAAMDPEPTQEFFSPYQAVYSTVWKKGISFKVEGEQTLTKKANNTWQFEFSVDTFLASLNENVTFKTDKQTIRPLHYSYKSSVLGKQRDAKLTFDWNKMTVLNDVKNKPWRMKITDRTIDRLGLQLQLRYDLLNNVEELQYDVADGGKIKHFVFERQKTEQINTKLGKLDVIKVARTDNLSDKRHSYFWFAPEYDYLLVRMEHFEKGESYTLDLEKISENIAHK